MLHGTPWVVLTCLKVPLSSTIPRCSKVDVFTFRYQVLSPPSMSMAFARSLHSTTVYSKNTATVHSQKHDYA